MSVLPIDVVCCDDSPELYTRIVTRQIDADELEQRLIETVQQDLEAGRERGLHTAARHPGHGSLVGPDGVVRTMRLLKGLL